MGLFKGRKNKGDCGPEPCDDCGDCDCAECCPIECSEKSACCKPGCSPKMPCVSCIKCGVKPVTCANRPKRTCVLAKSCCK